MHCRALQHYSTLQHTTALQLYSVYTLQHSAPPLSLGPLWAVTTRLHAEDPAAFEAKMRAQLPTSKCCLCGEAFQGYGHNAHPVRDEGVACDACNGAIVLRASASGRREPPSRPERDRRPVAAGSALRRSRVETDPRASEPRPPAGP